MHTHICEEMGTPEYGYASLAWLAIPAIVCKEGEKREQYYSHGSNTVWVYYETEKASLTENERATDSDQ